MPIDCENLPGHKGGVEELITCAEIEGVLTPDGPTIAAAIERGVPIKWVSQWRMRFMVSCDLGPQWRDAAKWPVLFTRRSKKGGGYEYKGFDYD